MKKLLKVVLALFIPLAIILGGVYGAAKFGVIPVNKYAKSNKMVAATLKKIGLYKEPKKANAITLTPASAPDDPLADQKKQLDSQRTALNDERASMEAEFAQGRRDKQRAAEKAAEAAPDPKNVARLATVYEQMPSDAMAKIFSKLPDDQVIALLQRMDEKPVSQFLAAVAPERAARLTTALSRTGPKPPETQ